MTDEITTPSPRYDGWTPQRQCVFLEALADDGHVRRACQRAGMSHESAYQLRRRHDGTAFKLGWDAALLLARTGLADTLMERALDGQEDVIVRDDDGRTRTRTRHDNRLALALLGRLDRFADDGHVTHADAHTVSTDWEAFLGLVARGADAGGLAAFLDARKPAPDAASEPCQLCGQGDDDGDPEDRLREAYSVWWDGDADEYRTNFPPPPGFDGDEEGDPDTAHRLNTDYQRSLTPLEAERETAFQASDAEELRTKAHAYRRDWFGFATDEECQAGTGDFAPCSGPAEAVS